MRGNFVVLFPNFCDLGLILQVEKYSLSCKWSNNSPSGLKYLYAKKLKQVLITSVSSSIHSYLHFIFDFNPEL